MWPSLPKRKRAVESIASELWIQRYPLSLLGTQVGRTVTVLRLASGDLILHSTGPFSASDVEAIRRLGRPGWMVEATLFHDTFAAAGRKAFPDVPYLDARHSAKPPPAWRDDVAVLELRGMPKVREHVFLHRPSRTLIVADLVFNFGAGATSWTRQFFRWAAGVREVPGISRLFRACIRDRPAFSASIREMLSWDFDRLIVGHGDIVEHGAKGRLAAALARHGYGSEIDGFRARTNAGGGIGTSS